MYNLKAFVIKRVDQFNIVRSNVIYIPFIKYLGTKLMSEQSVN